jgi:hypothetical protein
VKRSHKAFLSIAALASVAQVGAAAFAIENPATLISFRNAFRLEPRLPVVVVDSTTPPPPALKLVGLTTLGGKRALLMGAISSRPGESAKGTFFVLGESQREGEIEVITIDENHCVVTVEAFGRVIALAFDTNDGT